MTEDMIDLGGVSVRYRDSGGAGPVLLMSSGIGQSLEFWDRQFEALSGAFRLIAWDYPAHGESEPGADGYSVDSLAKLCIALLDKLAISEATLVGNSLGGAVSLRAQSIAPRRVQGLVLAAPAFSGRKVFAPFKLFTLPILGPLLTKPSDKAVEMQVTGVFHPRFTPDATLLAAIRRNVFKPGAQGPFLRFMRDTLSLTGVRGSIIALMRDLYSTCPSRLLIIHGQQDQIIPFEQSQACAALARNAQFVLFEDCGHAPQLEHPEQFNALVRDFAGTAVVAGLRTVP